MQLIDEEDIIETVRETLMVLDGDLKIIFADHMINI